MLGAIIGDIVGSRYERHNIKTVNFPFFDSRCCYTDDTIMTVAVADAILKCSDFSDEKQFKETLIDSVHHFGNRHISAGYGRKFRTWLMTHDRKPYGSYGNGSAMRVSPAAECAQTLEEARRIARLTAEITHNHHEGIRGAESVASAIWLARNCTSKEEIANYIKSNFYPEAFEMSIDEIRPDYGFDVSCRGSVPIAIQAFLESENFEDAVRLAVSVGGDSDTIAAIAGSIAEAFYGIPTEMKSVALDYLDTEMREVTNRFIMTYL